MGLYHEFRHLQLFSIRGLYSESSGAAFAVGMHAE